MVLQTRLQEVTSKLLKQFLPNISQTSTQASNLQRILRLYDSNREELRKDWRIRVHSAVCSEKGDRYLKT